MMRLIIAGITASIALVSTAVAQDTTVRGYTRQDGTYVQPHHRTTPDNTRSNNYSTQGNTNPYTGQAGTVDPFKPSPPSSNSFNPGGSIYGTPRRP